MNLALLRHELRKGIYRPQPLTTFTLRDPKTRKISKSANPLSKAMHGDTAQTLGFV